MNALAVSQRINSFRRFAKNPAVRYVASRVIQRGVRAWQRRRRVMGNKRRRMGVTPVAMRMLRSSAANPSRRVQQPDSVLPSDDPVVERTLYVKELCRIDQGTGIVNRNRDCLYLSGVKICMNVANATDLQKGRSHCFDVQ